MEPTEPTIVRQVAALLDSQPDSLREELREFRQESRQESREFRRALRQESREFRQESREFTQALRKEMRFLAVCGAGFLVAGILYLDTRMADLSVRLARVEADLALLIERVPIQ